MCSEDMKPHRLCVWLWTALVSLSSVHVIRAECPHQPSGATLRRWSDSSQWPSGTKPTEGSDVVISDTVLLDESPPQLNSITVNAEGSLVFSPEGDLTLKTNYMMLHGALHIGSEDCLFTARARIILTGTRGKYNITGYGEKFIAVRRGATLELHGQNKRSWTKLTSTVPKPIVGDGLLYDKKADTLMATGVRGLVSYVINGTTGNVKFKRTANLVKGSSYRLRVDPPALLQALNETEDGDLLIMAVHWNAIGSDVGMEPLYDAIETAAYGHVTNKSSVRRLREYDAWAMVAVRGQWVKEDLGSRLNGEFRKEARVTAAVTSLNRVVSVLSNTRPARYQNGFTEVKFATPKAGSRVLTVANDVTSWRAGDKVLLTSTDYDWKQAEIGEVVYCSPAECNNTQVKVLLVNKYMHYGEVTQGVDERTEAALLSRNIVIEGEVQDECIDANGNCGSYKQDTFGGYITIEAGFKDVHIEGVQLLYMGQTMEEDHHPLFFRQCGLVDASNGSSYTTSTYVRSTSIVNSFNKCVVLSGTHGLIIKDNVAYDHYSHCYFLKEGGEKYTVIDGNLGAGTRIMSGYIPLDGWATTFVITNPLTYFRNNAGAGGDKRGAWYVFPLEPVGESAGKGIMQNEEAKRTAYTQFYNNAFHSYHEMGVRLDNTLDAEGRTAYGSNSYSPKVNPLDKDSDDKPTILERLHLFKNRYQNSWIRGGYFIVDHSSFGDSRRSVVFGRASDQPQHLENSVIVGESDNIGEPTVWWDKVHEVHVHLSRSQPLPWDIQQPIGGMVSMDGPNYLSNVRFHGFIPNENRSAGALTFPGNSAWASSSVNEVENLEFTFNNGYSKGLRMYFGEPDEYGFGERDGDLQVTLRDKDGSLTGSAGSTVVKNFTVYTTDQCYYRDDWQLAVCPHKYGKLDLHGARKKTRPILTRDDVDPAQGLELPNEHRARYPVILGGSHSYILHWTKYIPNPFTFLGMGFEKDFGVRVGVCIPRNAEFELWSHEPEWRPRKSMWTEVNSVEVLDRDTEGDRYFWDKTNGILFFKMTNHRTRCPDFKGECKDGCPYIKISFKKGNMSDSDCRNRIADYARTPISSENALTFKRLRASAQLSTDLGAGEQVPFTDRPALDGGYGDWSAWGPCTTTCGGGTQIRTRPCDSPMPENNGLACVGPREESRVCGNMPCEIDGGWGAWSEWSQCQAIEDNVNKGFQVRSRDCDNPAPQYNGVACVGFAEQMQGCTMMAV